MSFISASIDQVNDMTKPQKKFVTWLVEIWVMLPVRHNFLNLFRYGGGHYCEKSIRQQFNGKINFSGWFDAAFSGFKKKECIAAFDPSYIPKSGKNTYGIGRFWSSKDSRAKRGIEISCLALVDVSDATAYSVEAVQTPPDKQESRMKHYVQIIRNNSKRLLSYTEHLAVDGYFMKKTFIGPVLEMGLQVITRMRQDANLQYIYKGRQKQGRGRKRTNGGKVDVSNIDKRRWKYCYENDHILVFELIAKSVTLNRIVKVVYLQSKQTKRHTILLSTDIDMEAAKIIRYYSLRFQIEFLIRDAKQHMGLEECQAVSETKLYNHFNFSLMTVSLMKLTCWADLPNKDQIPFSMRSIKTWFYNKFLTETIFSNLGLELNCNKIKRIYSKCLNIGSIAA